MANRDHKGAYTSWRRMRQRLNHRQGYLHLDMDPRWDDFQLFLEDLGERPLGLTLERIDGTKGYWPWNCKWASMKEQSNNRQLRTPAGASVKRFISAKKPGCFDVELTIRGKPLYIKRCYSLEEAILVRDTALQTYGDFVAPDLYPVARTETPL